MHFFFPLKAVITVKYGRVQSVALKYYFMEKEFMAFWRH